MTATTPAAVAEPNHGTAAGYGAIGGCMFSGRHYLQALLYPRHVAFSDMGPFMSLVDPLFRDLPFEFESVKRALDQARLLPEQPSAQHTALHRQVVSILEASVRFGELSSTELMLKNELDVSTALTRAADKISAVLENLGIAHSRPDLYFVEAYPEPFGDSEAHAITFDNNDLALRGIQPGVYFKRVYLRPFLSVLMLCHEFTHLIMNRHGEPFFGGALEEGIAELFGCCFLLPDIYDRHVAETLIIYHRLTSGYGKFQDSFLDYARQATLLSEVIGFSGVVGILQSDRSRLKKIEQDLWLGNLSRSDPEVAETDFKALSRRAYLLYGKAQICSPLAWTIAQHCQKGDTVSSLASRHSFAAEDVTMALSELSAIPRLVETIGDEVAFSDCERLVHPTQLRFAVPPNIKRLAGAP